MESLTIAGFSLQEQVVGQPVASSVLARPGVIVMRDIETGLYAVSDTPDLKWALNMLTQGKNFSTVFVHKYHDNVAKKVRVWYRQLKQTGLSKEFQLTRNHCRIALLGELAPPGQNEGVFNKVKAICVKNPKAYDRLVRHILCLPTRMERAHAQY
jgi:hypothetical protein